MLTDVTWADALTYTDISAGTFLGPRCHKDFLPVYLDPHDHAHTSVIILHPARGCLLCTTLLLRVIMCHVSLYCATFNVARESEGCDLYDGVEMGKCEAPDI